MSMIPDDIIVEILVKLPARKLRLLRRVSKSWCSLIGNSSFINMHLHHSIITNSNRALVFSNGLEIYCSQVEDVIDYNINKKLSCPRKLSPDLVVFGSCNGLILLCEWCLPSERECCDVIDDFGIWNPNSGEYKCLPVPSHELHEDVYHRYGFGFDSTRHDYIVVRVTYLVGLDVLVHESNTYEIDIYSLKSNSWRKSNNVSLASNMLLYLDQVNGVFASDALHWAGSDPMESPVILAFDIGMENLRFVAPPDFSVKMEWIKIEELNGKLFFCSLGENRFITLWIMREYGVKDSWMKLLSISSPISSSVENGSWHFRGYLYEVLARPLAYLSSGNKILLTTPDGKLILYDLATNTEEEIKIKLLNGSFPAYSCVDSLVQLSAYNNL